MPELNEQDILKLRAQVNDTATREAKLRSEADVMVKAMLDGGADLKTRENVDKIDQAYIGADAMRDEVIGLRSLLSRAAAQAGDSPLGAAARAASDAHAPAARMRQSELITHRFRSSDSFTALEKSGRLVTGSARIDTDPVEILTREESMSALRTRTTFDNSTAIGGGLLIPDFTEHIVEQLIRRVRLLDVVTMGTTDTNTVDWIQEQPRTDAAAPTVYGSAAPESAYGFQHIQVVVKRIPHFVPATKGILMDAGQTRTLLESRLITGLQLAVEQQMFNGSGSGENLEGFVNATTPTGGQGALGGIARGTDTQLDAVHKAITNIRVSSVMNIEPTVILISPADYEKVLLQKTTQGAYIYANPTAGNVPTLWGLLPVVTPLVADGAPWVGNFKDACMTWMRMGVELSASDSHASFFTQGLVALLAETRLAFKTVRPLSICGITGF